MPALITVDASDLISPVDEETVNRLPKLLVEADCVVVTVVVGCWGCLKRLKPLVDVVTGVVDEDDMDVVVELLLLLLFVAPKLNGLADVVVGFVVIAGWPVKLEVGLSDNSEGSVVVVVDDVAAGFAPKLKAFVVVVAGC